MLILGVIETFEFVDGTTTLPVLRALAGIDEVVAIAAPALAEMARTVVREARAGQIDGAECRRMLARLESILPFTEPPKMQKAAAVASRAYHRLLTLERSQLETFARLVAATQADPLDPPDAETFAIAIAYDAKMLLLDNAWNREQVAKAERAGLILRTQWLPQE